MLVNNAGIAVPGTVETTSDEDLDLMLDVNVKGTVYMSRAALPALRRRGGGVIVNVASVAAIRGHVDRAVSAATKGAAVASPSRWRPTMWEKAFGSAACAPAPG